MFARLVAAFLALSPFAADRAIAATAINEGFVTTAPGIRIHDLQSGDERSPQALILLPGWRLPAWLWREQLEKFGGSYRVIAIDPRSQNESTKTEDGNTPEVRAKDLHAVLAQLQVSQSVLVGWSQGVQDVAAYLKAFGTGGVAGVVLVDSTVSAGPEEVSLHAAASKAELSNIALYARVPDDFTRGMMQAIFAHPHPAFDTDALVRASLKTPTSVGIAMLTADIFGADRRAALAKLDKPAVVIASGKSPELDDQKAMAASIPGGTFVVVNDAAHTVFIDQPQRFDDILGAFLASLPGWKR